jgi:hypothetical protein
LWVVFRFGAGFVVGVGDGGLDRERSHGPETYPACVTGV